MTVADHQPVTILIDLLCMGVDVGWRTFPTGAANAGT
jgi:hypothetical protein